MASTALSASEPCRECHGVHTTSYGKQRCVLRKHRIEMRIMTDLISQNNLTGELQDNIVEETGNTGYWLGHASCFDELVEDTEKLEMQERLAEKGDAGRFILAIRSGIKLQKVTVEEELRAENAGLRRRVAAFEADMGNKGGMGSMDNEGSTKRL